MLKRVDAAPRKIYPFHTTTTKTTKTCKRRAWANCSYTLRLHCVYKIYKICNTHYGKHQREVNCTQNKNKRTKKPASQLRTQLNDCEMKRAAASDFSYSLCLPAHAPAARQTRTHPKHGTISFGRRKNKKNMLNAASLSLRNGHWPVPNGIDFLFRLARLSVLFTIITIVVFVALRFRLFCEEWRNRPCTRYGQAGRRV